MSGPMRPTYTDEQALSDTWDAIAAYEQEVDALIKRAVQNKPGYIDSMTYDAGKRTLKTELQTLQATYDADADQHIKEVGFSESDQTQTHGACEKHREITNIEPSTSPRGVTLTLTFNDEKKTTQTVTFIVPNAKGPDGNHGEDEKWPASGEVKKSGGTATKYGKNGEKVAEASSAFATGSATGVSASISLVSLSATGVSISVPLLDAGCNGVFSGFAAHGGEMTAAENKSDVSRSTVSTLDVEMIGLKNEFDAFATRQDVVQLLNAGSKLESGNLIKG